LSAKCRVEATPWIGSQNPHQHQRQATLQQPLDHRHGETSPETMTLIGGEQVDGVQFAAIDRITAALGSPRRRGDRKDLLPRAGEEVERWIAD
jgi:hypothetical protein